MVVWKVRSFHIRVLDLKPNKALEKKEDTSVKKLRVATLNVNHLRNKTDEACALLRKHMPAVICMQETHVKAPCKSNLRGYQTIETYKNENSPGLLIGVRCGLKCTSKKVIQKDNMLGIRITC
ncbi:hypothetical protein NUSPORA_02604 [Nucleospora cyclopteri]